MKQYLVAPVLTAFTTSAGPVRAETMERQMQALLDGFHTDYTFLGVIADIVLPDGKASSLRHYAEHGVTIAFQINTDVGIADGSTGLVPALDVALSDLAIGAVQ